jgi:flagellin
MSITIATNVASLNAQNNLASSSNTLNKSFERLSSGLRITSASDDAAGLAIADKLRADVRIAGQSIRNANDGISAIAIADGALNEIGNILARMGELADQSANGTLSSDQRTAISDEFNSLGSEIQRISQVTKFNDISLISGGDNITLQVGLDATADSRITIEGVEGNLAALGLNSDATSSALANTVDTADNAQAALTAVKDAVSSLSTNRGKLGAAESRLNSAIANLQVTRENFSAAESQIRDVDVAAEAAELTRVSILQQAGTAVLAQANQQPGLALSLLG